MITAAMLDKAGMLDKKLVRLRFERVAPRYDAAAVLAREVGARMLDRLDLVKLEPERILDAGAGTRWLGARLAARYPRAGVIELDLSLAMLRAGARGTPWWRRLLAPGDAGRRRAVCGDMEQLPLAGGSVQLVCSNLALAWSSRPEAALREFHRVLARGGLLMFTTFGPDTLRELRAALGPDASAAVHPFLDMHDIGDALVNCGFAGPVMDMEHLVLTYPDLDALLAELRAVGGGCALKDRARGLRGRSWRARLEARYAELQAGGRLPATFEIVYGHAWKPEQPSTTEDGRAVIRLERLAGKRAPGRARPS
jgi:malonyl-CoA O-methyltransferase